MKREELETGLRGLGLEKGDIVLLHSALSSLGNLEGGVGSLVEAFLNVLGKEGTLVVPSFTAGIVPDAVKNDPRAVVSVAPTAQVAAIGAKAKEICADHWKCETAHAEGTPYLKLADLGGYICLLGVDQDRNTTLHSVEALLRLPYLSETSPKEIDTPEGKVTTSFKYFPGPHRDFIGLDKLFSEKIKTVVIGNAVARLIKSKDLVDISVAAGKKNPAFVLCDNPACDDCVRQRAQLRVARLKEEKFTLVSSAVLAGRYVPEMIENCKAAAIEHIELDYVQGKPVQFLSAEALQKQVEELNAGGLKVTALKTCAVPADMPAFLAKTKACGVARLVLPLTFEAEAVMKSAKENNLEILFYNLGLSGKATSDKLLSLNEAGFECGFVFHAANFARAGEHPFLGTFKTRCRRFMKQLEVADALYDCRDVGLARGNAEIKELVSILRCSSFAGNLVLGEGLRATGSLKDATERFWDLVDNM
jgi:aminoglycoside 3-N-acetyltransferase